MTSLPGTTRSFRCNKGRRWRYVENCCHWDTMAGPTKPPTERGHHGPISRLRVTGAGVIQALVEVSQSLQPGGLRSLQHPGARHSRGESRRQQAPRCKARANTHPHSHRIPRKTIPNASSGYPSYQIFLRSPKLRPRPHSPRLSPQPHPAWPLCGKTRACSASRTACPPTTSMRRQRRTTKVEVAFKLLTVHWMA